MPWPPDISEAPELAGVAELAAGAGLRLQAIAPAASGPAGGTVEKPRRVIYYGAARPGWAGPLWRRERSAGPGDGLLAEVVAELVGTGDGPPPGPGPEVVDLLVCTHGRRDTCCGARGTDLVRALAEDGAPRTRARAGAAAAGRRRLRATGALVAYQSHRRPPLRPDGPGAAVGHSVGLGRRGPGRPGGQERGAAERRGEPLPGLCHSGAPAHQAVEKSVLAEVGWPLLSSWRRARALDDGWVRLEADGAGTWEARAVEGRHVPQPECRTPPQLASKQSVEWVVEALHQVAPEPR